MFIKFEYVLHFNKFSLKKIKFFTKNQSSPSDNDTLFSLFAHTIQ